MRTFDYFNLLSNLSQRCSIWTMLRFLEDFSGFFKLVFMFMLCLWNLFCAHGYYYPGPGPGKNLLQTDAKVESAKIYLHAVALALPFTGTKGPYVLLGILHSSRMQSPGIHQTLNCPLDCWIVKPEFSQKKNKKTCFHCSRVIFTCILLQHSVVLLCEFVWSTISAVVAPKSFQFTIITLTVDQGGNFINWLMEKVASYDSATFTTIL